MDREEIDFMKAPEPLSGLVYGTLLAFSAYVIIMTSGFGNYFARDNISRRPEAPLTSTQTTDENRTDSPPDIVQRLQNGNEPMNEQSGIDYKLQE